MVNYKKRKDSAITVQEALKASGVLEISASYFGLKFCYYGLMMWLPLYVRTTENNLGALIGGFVIGLLTDLMGSRRYPALVIAIIIGSIFTHNLKDS